MSEVAATEKKVDEIMKHIQEIAGSISVNKTSSVASEWKTLPLFENLQQSDITLKQSDLSPIHLPDNFLNITIGRSTFAPLIFCALATLHLNNESPTTKQQIRKVINEMLLDENNQKSNSSIERAFDSTTLQSQEWFHAKPNGYYELTHGWEEHWVDIFGTAPKLRDLK